MRYFIAGAALSQRFANPATRERIALAVAEVNGRDHCLSARAYLGRNLAHLDDAEITASRSP